MDKSNNKLNKTTSVMMVCTLISRIMGFARVMVIGTFFGITKYADILNLVLSVPNNFRKLFAEGALSASFMPLFAQSVKSDKHENIKKTEESQLFFSTLMFWFALFVGLLVITMNIFAKPIISFLFHFDTQEETVTAVQLFSFTVYFLFFNTLSAILIGMQQTHKKFFLASMLPTVLSLSVISFIFVFEKSLGIFSAGIGYLVGGLLQLSMLLISLMSLGYKLRLSWKFSTYVKQTIIRMIPASLAVITPIIGQQVAFYLASSLPEGSSSAFSYAIVFWQLPIGVVFNSIIMVSFSHIITALGNNNDITKVAEYEQGSIYSLLFFSIPIGVAMFFFAHAGISIALQRGKFNSDAAFLTSQILQGYALSLIPYGVYQMMNKFLYARGKTNMVFVFSAIFTLVDIILSVILIRGPLMAQGLSYAYALSCVIVLPILAIYLRKYTVAHILPMKKTVKLFLANVPFLIFAFVISHYTQSLWYAGANVLNVLLFIGIFIFLAITYLGTCWITKVKVPLVLPVKLKLPFRR